MSSPDELDRALAALRPRVPKGFALRVEAAIARDAGLARRRRSIAIATASVAIAATFAWMVHAAAPTPVPADEVASWRERVLRGTERVRLPWVTVTGLDAVTHAELLIVRTETAAEAETAAETETETETETAAETETETETRDRDPKPETAPGPFTPIASSQEDPMFAKAAIALVATAGAVLTVHVVHGRAAVHPTDRPAFVLAAGDRAEVPASGAATITREGTQTAAIGRTAPLPPRHAVNVSEPAEEMANECPGEGPDGECECAKGKCPMAEEHGPSPATRVELDVAAAPAMGPANAKITIVEITDFQCPYCEKAVATVHDLAALYPDDVRVVIKHFPLPNHKQARGAAIASMAAHRQGKFWEMHEMLFSNQERLDRDSMVGFAKHLGLDVVRFERDLADPEISAQVDADAAEAVDKGFRGVPSFTVNGRTVMGALPLDAMRVIVDEELAKVRGAARP